MFKYTSMRRRDDESFGITREKIAGVTSAIVLVLGLGVGVTYVAVKFGPETVCHPEGTQKVRVLGGWTVDTVIQKIENMNKSDYWELCRDGEAKELAQQYGISEANPPIPGMQLIIPARMSMDDGF